MARLGREHDAIPDIMLRLMLGAARARKKLLGKTR
jgi:hypothetical protein